MNILIIFGLAFAALSFLFLCYVVYVFFNKTGKWTGLHWTGKLLLGVPVFVGFIEDNIIGGLFGLLSFDVQLNGLPLSFWVQRHYATSIVARWIWDKYIGYIDPTHFTPKL